MNIFGIICMTIILVMLAIVLVSVIDFVLFIRNFAKKDPETLANNLRKINDKLNGESEK